MKVAPSDASPYLGIDDWSTEARRVLVESNERVIRILITQGFETFFDAVGAPTLTDFGFASDRDFEDWVLSAFVTRDFELGKLHCTTTEIFTHTRFWLAQKVGIRGYRATVARATSKKVTRSPRRSQSAGPDDPRDAASDEVRAELSERAGLALRLLRRRTCPDIVAYWLLSTRTFMRAWFGGHGPQAEPSSVPRSRKEKSVLCADARFRYLCLLLDVVPKTPEEARERAVVAWLFTETPNRPPYRTSDREVLARLLELGFEGVKDVRRACRRGASSLLKRCDERLGGAPASWCERFERDLAGRSISKTTLHAFDLDDKQWGLTDVIARLSRARGFADGDEGQ